MNFVDKFVLLVIFTGAMLLVLDALVGYYWKRKRKLRRKNRLIHKVAK